METMAYFIFWGSKITADGDFSHEIKRSLLLGRKVMANQDGILKSRHITLPTNVCLVKDTVFPVVMYGCESWTIKKAECQRIDAFELWCWRRLLRVPWTARRSNQPILKEISPGFSLEGLMLKLKLEYFGHLMTRIPLATWKRPWCWERLRAGGEGDSRGRDGWMASPTRWTWVWVNSRNCWWTGRSVVLRSVGSQRIGHEWGTDWTELNLLAPCHHGSPAYTVSWTIRGALICLQNTTQNACLACSSPTDTHSVWARKNTTGQTAYKYAIYLISSWLFLSAFPNSPSHLP